MNNHEIRKEQLGLHPGTASNRLVKDILFGYIKRDDSKCFRCNGELTRETYSIDHIEPWLHSHDPVGLFFDLENISFSHLKCNTNARRIPQKKTPEEKRVRKNELNRRYRKATYCSEERRKRYIEKGY